MRCTHRVVVKQFGRLKIWDEADGFRCIVLESGLLGDKSRVRMQYGKSFEIPTDWLEPLSTDTDDLNVPATTGKCECPWSMLIRGCECGAIYHKNTPKTSNPW